MKKYFVSVFVLLFLFFHFSTASAELQTFIKEYTYQASEADSKLSSRTIALAQVKRLILEEIGTYLEGMTEVRNFQLEKDQISTLAAGVVRTEIIAERWDGKSYYLKTKITVDPDDVIKSIESLRKDAQKARELEEINEKIDAALRKIESLQKELPTAKGETQKKKVKQYNQTVSDLSTLEWIQKAALLLKAGKNAEAEDAITKAIEQNPRSAEGYEARGMIYFVLGDEQRGFQDLEKAIELAPKEEVWRYYSLRGSFNKMKRNISQALKDFDRAVELKPKGVESGSPYYAKKSAELYYERGEILRILGDYQRAIADFSEAILLNPERAEAFGNRGMCYAITGNDFQALIDYNRAIELKPESEESSAKVYFYRAATHLKLHDMESALKDFHAAAKLGSKEAQDAIEWSKDQARKGSKEAQDALRSAGIQW